MNCTLLRVRFISSELRVCLNRTKNMRFPIYIKAALFTFALSLSAFAGVAPYHVAPTAPNVVPATPKIDSTQAFREGEDLTFAIKWGVLTGGYSSLKVQNIETIDGRPTYHVVAEAR